MSYNYIKKSKFGFYETIDELRIEFAKEWFWVVSNVDIAEKIKLKIDSNFWKYVTLWFCNPKIAYKYLSIDINLWIFMPCSVSIYEKNWEVFINAWLPENVVDKVVDNKEIKQHSREVSDIMKKVVDNI